MIWWPIIKLRQSCENSDHNFVNAWSRFAAAKYNPNLCCDLPIPKLWWPLLFLSLFFFYFIFFFQLTSQWVYWSYKTKLFSLGKVSKLCVLYQLRMVVPWSGAGDAFPSTKGGGELSLRREQLVLEAGSLRWWIVLQLLAEVLVYPVGNWIYNPRVWSVPANAVDWRMFVLPHYHWAQAHWQFISFGEH